MNLIELLQQVDDRLRPLTVANESALQVVVDEVAASPRPEHIVPDAEPRVVLAVLLFEVEQECRMLREHLGVELTVAANLEAKVWVDKPDTEASPPT